MWEKTFKIFICGVGVLFYGKGSFGQDILSRLYHVHTVQDTIKSPDSSLADLERAIRDSRKLLAKYPHSDFTPNLMFQLAELYVKKSRIELEQKMEAYEDALNKYDAGLLSEEPAQPKVNFQSAIELCEQILKRYPNLDFKDKVLYRIAICYQEQGEGKKAKETFQRLIAEVPQSHFVAEAYFRIGEYYFDSGKYHQAIDAYKQVIEMQKWDNLFFDAALYKLGWSYYKIDDFSDAISTFVYLLDDIKTLEQTEVKILDRTIADLKKEALDYVAISFSEFGGAVKAKQFFQAIGEREYSVTVFHKLGDVFYQQGRFPQAIKAYQTLLELYPFYEKAPQIQLQIVASYEKQWDYESANRAREALVRNYGPGSSWLSRVKKVQLRTGTLALVEKTLFETGIYHQKRAIEGINPTPEYRLAVDRYKKFLQYFPQSPKSYQVTYYLAESLYGLKEYAAAAEVYQKVIAHRNETDYLEEAAYNRIICFDKLLRTSTASSPAIFSLQPVFGIVDSLKVNHPLQMQLILACENFTHLLPQSPKVPQVLSKEAEVFYNLGRYDLARRVYLKILQKYPQSEYARDASLMIAQSYFSEGQFAKAEEYYSRVLAALPDTSKGAQKAKRMLATSGFKWAESLKAKGDTLAAARKFEDVALHYPDAKAGEAAILEAVSLYQHLGQKDHAATLLEQYASSYPSSKLCDELLMKAATLRQELQQWRHALTDYLKVTESRPSPTVAPLALFATGTCYRQLKQWQQAKETFTRYIRLYSQDDPARYIESLFRIGEAEYELGHYKAALQAFTTTLDTYERLKDVGDYYAANAQFMIGELHYRRYKLIDLVPPFKKNLKRKRAAFNAVVQDYTKAAKFGIFEWTTAASYRIGMAFEEFSRAILESPPPAGLSSEQLEAYEDHLKQVALPMQKKALEVYRANIKRADAIGADNEWIQKSRERLGALQAQWSQNSGGGGEKITANQ